ncbi:MULTISPECIES: hypothetical protein [Streptomyces]|uniref:hypothetical protein n=1 Tax=Streptomyces TaxID=1883 RepID=UPI001E5C6D6D|nr:MULTISPECIES: hypothetical protein [Streptomyces]UFQ14914.1 hypothetical protein J2N69_07785 [Streptomyces huasconensis]WCL84520.1 hypothetical protein PPN52_07800 [Streptomyces sp. JCM 35825]
MNMRDQQDTYLTALAERLRAHGLSADRVEATVADLTAHLEESGTKDPEAEFGPVEEFARQLAPEAATPDGPPEEHVETWRWTADTGVDEELLNRFGDQGWEVERVDAVGRFVSHRDLARPQRWEYRRELITRGREDLDARLAPDGWEACGTWVIYAWFKRPKAASLGPAAEIAAPPPAPERTNFLSRKFYALLAFLGAAVVLGGIGAGLDDGDASSGFGFAAGLLAGACVPFGLIVGGRLLLARRNR